MSEFEIPKKRRTRSGHQAYMLRRRLTKVKELTEINYFSQDVTMRHDRFCEVDAAWGEKIEIIARLDEQIPFYVNVVQLNLACFYI